MRGQNDHPPDSPSRPQMCAMERRRLRCLAVIAVAGENGNERTALAIFAGLVVVAATAFLSGLADIW